MSFTKANYEDVEAKGGALHFLRDELGTENLGITVIDAEKGWEGMEHDHAEDEHEEVYLLVEGEVTAEIEGEEVTMKEGDAVRVPGESQRKLTAEKDSKIVAVGAP
jgi:quercetin dioxygenase-like cupin family protein